MKISNIFFFAFLLFCSCDSPNQQPPVEEPTMVIDSSDLLGPISRIDLQQAPFNEWFESGYQSYLPDSAAISNVDLNGVKIMTFMGTWCSDSQREMPHLYKILDEINYPENKLDVIAIDEDKAQPEEEIRKWSIEYVPTIILLKNEIEVGRIVEAPAETLEKDLLQMLEKED
ncbi:MAG: thioredoxin family protein [Bacteroidota bacterium]